MSDLLIAFGTDGWEVAWEIDIVAMAADPVGFYRLSARLRQRVSRRWCGGLVPELHDEWPREPQGCDEGDDADRIGDVVKRIAVRLRQRAQVGVALRADHGGAVFDLDVVAVVAE